MPLAAALVAKAIDRGDGRVALEVVSASSRRLTQPSPGVRLAAGVAVQ
jgi:hypothetical protein